jgi:NAD(P)-dependent dehydrogenase (short-subunit alcohol dehydrogenase family)
VAASTGWRWGLWTGRVAIITGAGRGVGRERALLVARHHGAKVVVKDLGGASDSVSEDRSAAQRDKVLARMYGQD